MPKKISQPVKKAKVNPQKRAQRLQQVLFLGLAVIVVLSMVLALVIH